MGPAFLQQRVFAILRSPEGSRLRAAIDAIASSGMRTVEVTLTTPGAVDEIAEAAARHRAMSIGAGTVLDAATVSKVAAAGASFCVSPVTDPEVIGACLDAGIPAVPGAATPTEILAACRAGATAVKLVPARPDGPSFVRQVLGPLPDVRLVPTGWIEIDDVPSYLAAGAAAVGLTVPLVGDALDGGDLEALTARCRRALAAAG